MSMCVHACVCASVYVCTCVCVFEHVFRSEGNPLGVVV